MVKGGEKFEKVGKSGKNGEKWRKVVESDGKWPKVGKVGKSEKKLTNNRSESSIRGNGYASFTVNEFNRG